MKVTAVVGAGGKTSLIHQYAKEALSQGLHVFVTTSTHMYAEENTLLTDDADRIIEELEHTHYAMAGILEGEKIRELSWQTYCKVCEHADLVLIEADGSKHKSVKIPGRGEPVIYDNVNEIVVVCGMHAVGRTIAEAAHRPELVKQCLQAEDDTVLTAEQIQTLVRKGYVEPMQEKFPEKTIRIKPMGAVSLYEKAAAKLMEADMDVSVLKQEWFCPKPSLVICGAGHVSCELAKLAACLDFHITVIDDRPEFVTEERFPDAEKRICDSFDHLSNYLEPNAYYVIVTRGHKDDFTCVKTILDHSYQYLGMIGSRRKVQMTFERLRETGATEEQIQTIFAPIGLKIGAVTPAEIAVSILGQIIQEKNKKGVSSVSETLLNVQKSGVLCIIIEKKGSAPRGAGSMMYVTDSEVIDTIGGGAIEFAAIEDAKICTEVMVKEYTLDSEKSRELGMICGGSAKVLFLPIS